jgi:AraC-like DNA-binding protein
MQASGLLADPVLPEGPDAGQAFVTRDADEAVAYFQDAYRTTMKFSGVRDGRLYRHSRLDAGGVAVDEVVLPLRTGVELSPFGSLVIINLDTGLFERECAGVSERFVAGDVFIDADPQLPARLRMLDNRLHTTMIDMAVLDQVADITERKPVPLRFTAFQPVSREAAGHWKRTVDYFIDTISQPELAACPLVRGPAMRMVAGAALTTFPNTALRLPGARDERDASSITLRRAVAFIEQYPDRDLSVADIAAAAYVSTRAVQIAFRRHLDTTPMSYLRRVRLDRVHRALLAADPGSGATATAIALDWGFVNYSRFATLYRATYGVAPRTTLHSG